MVSVFSISFKTTDDIKVPHDPFDRIIGQEEAVMFARLVAKQHRNILLVGPPGTGKSMIAKAIASILPRPKQEVSVLDNPQNPNRPIIQVRKADDILNMKKPKIGEIVNPTEVPSEISERLGFRCKRCGAMSHYSILVCPTCGSEKYQHANMFSTMIGMQNPNIVPEFGEKQVITQVKDSFGRDKRIVYERLQNGMIRVLREGDLKKLEEYKRMSRRNILVPLNRSVFVQSGAGSETELLGDVKHDPYGNHPQLGTRPYLRVVPGAVHEAHEGVLFIDELSMLEDAQRFLLSAMQDKYFPIVGRNPTSSGASVKVDKVPCDFILVAAINIGELDTVMPALRSRVRGDGYEILMKNSMPNTLENRNKIAQFVAQEILRDGKIPHATRKATEKILEHGITSAKRIDDAENSITLRLRELSGVVKLAGDFAVLDGSKLINSKHVKRAIKHSKSLEVKLSEDYGNWWGTSTADDAGDKSHTSGSEVI